MFILAKRSVLLPSVDGKQRHFVPNGYMGEIPEWAVTDYFRELVADGKICITESTKDKDLQKADEKPAKVRRGTKE